MATLSVKFKREVPQAREVVGPLTNHAFHGKKAASEQQPRSPQVPRSGMSRTEARSGEAADSLVQLRLTLARRSSAGSSATASTCGGAQRGNPNPYPPHTNTLHEPELLCPFYLTYEWFVSHRWHADIDDDMRMQPSCWQTRPNTNREETGSLASVGRDDGGRGCADPVRRVWGCVAGHASGS